MNSGWRGGREPRWYQLGASTLLSSQYKAFTWEWASVALVSEGTSRWAEKAGQGGRGQKDDGRQSTPTDGTALTLPREEANSCPQAYLMLWLKEQARAGVRAASLAHLRNLIPSRQLASAWPAASSVASASQGALVAAIFAPV